MLKIKDLRDSFIDYFKERGHRIVPSSPLVPKDDPTLLFTTAGMVQFKPMFAGTVELEYTRAASIQKCLRTSDLENVGRTKRHLSFFEMLGNFSFGDYFKNEAIEFAWDYSTRVIGFDPEKIWVSIYLDDDEAFDIWTREIGVPAERIVRLGKEDNFWGPAGDSGACGPCSELYIDRGEEYGCGLDSCAPGCDCERYMEYWNLVFNQFNQDVKGALTPLPRTGIDTGMGLERLATLVQGVDSVYETDELASLISFITEHTGIPYKGENVIPLHVMVEHARTLTFAMSDGVYPSNEGRGYVLRRVLRRALRFSRQAGIKEPFLYRIVDPVVEAMGKWYPEIRESANVKKAIQSEEERFLETIENGMERLENIMADLDGKKDTRITGRDAFMLYDTFGFPFEMTREMAEERGIAVDEEGFEQEMQNQRERGRSSWKGNSDNTEKIFSELARESGDTIFSGYEQDESDAVISHIHTGEAMADELHEGEKGFLVLDTTPFYGEAGGQVGDTGIITTGDARFEVEDTKKYNKTIIHTGILRNGIMRKGEKVHAEINVVPRNLTRANHTATHLLQAALRSTLGEHVKQAGSMVSPDRLRFDFSHFNALSDDEIREIEDQVNREIWKKTPVTTKVMELDEAIADGAMAVFDEKYDDTVRVVSVEGFSKELCGGTHVSNTGEIGLFTILRESSPGAGMRRIEAITLQGVLDRYRQQREILNELNSSFNANDDDLVRKIRDMQQRTRALEKELDSLKKESATSGIDELLKNAETVGGIKVIVHATEDQEMPQLREMADALRGREPELVVLLGSTASGKASLLFAATRPAVDKGFHAENCIKAAAGAIGGGGGGRPDMAQAGGKKPAGLDEALRIAREETETMIG